MPKHRGGKYKASRGHTQAQNRFAEIPRANIQRSAFDRSCGLKTAFDAAFLVPIFVDEALPGDTMNLRTSAVVRMTNPIVPVMDNIYLDFFYFAVPVRLVWDNWQKFNGEQVDPGDSTDFLVPQITETPAEESLSDYFGIPIGNELTFSALWHRAYNLIWNEWFRDENLQDSLTVPRDDGPDDPLLYELKRRGKRHDYFTSCLPFPQKGEAVSLPLGLSAPVVPVDTISGTSSPTFQTVAGGLSGDSPLRGTIGNNNADWLNNSIEDQAYWKEPGLETDLSAATAATINDIREAFQIQRLLERDARGGSRYTEIVRSHFGVISPDQRLQRPEYLGGGSTPIVMHPIARTVADSSATANTDGVGQLGAFALGVANGVGFVRSFEEHCVILGFANVRADLTYQQGLNRMFSRRTRYDFFWPALAHLGEQEVLTKEIFANGSPTDDDVFGYQERYAEYRYKPSHVTGKLRSDAFNPLDVWHLALDFSSAPLLNDVFIEDDPPIARVVAVPAEPDFRGDFYFQYHCARPMPTYGVPGMIDHF